MAADPYYDNYYDGIGGVPQHMQRERNNNNNIFWGVAIGAALGAYMAYYGLKWPRGIWTWCIWTFLVPACICFAIAVPDWSFKANDPTQEWVSALIMWTGAYLIVMCIIGVICTLIDWNRQHEVNQAARQQAAVQQQEEEYNAAVQAGVDKVRYDHAVARATGQAVAEALRNQRPPESPTGAPQRPTAPPPGPPAPMGSTSPTLWVPTYQGPSRELQRRETSLDGLWMNDHRRIDPDEL